MSVTSRSRDNGSVAGKTALPVVSACARPVPHSRVCSARAPTDIGTDASDTTLEHFTCSTKQMNVQSTFHKTVEANVYARLEQQQVYRVHVTAVVS